MPSRPARRATCGCGSAATQKLRDLTRDTPGCAPKPIDLSRAGECDFVGQQDGSLCLLPFPDDYYTVADPATPHRPAGRAADARRCPRTVGHPHRRGARTTSTTASAPGSRSCSGFPAWTRRRRSRPPTRCSSTISAATPSADAPVVVIDAETGERWPIWVELDSNATSPAKTALMINPAVNFVSGHRYIVALRDLRTGDGAVIGAPRASATTATTCPRPRPRSRPSARRFDSIFDTLRGAGIRRSNLYLAWDFTVASDENIAGRMLAMRNDAFGQLGDTTMADLTVQGSSPGVHGHRRRRTSPRRRTRRSRARSSAPTRSRATWQPDCAPGGRFALGSDGLPTRNGDYTAKFDCIIPRVAVDGSDPVTVRPSLYGHGLFGTLDQVRGQYQKDLANDHGFILCATDEIGMASEDVPNTAGILTDLSDFPELADRLQQGLLNELYPRPADDPPGRLRLGARVPRRRHRLDALGDRHRAALLRRQQPGRDHGRGAGRGRPGLHPRRARRAGDALLDPASALGRLRRVRGAASTPPTRTSSRDRCCSR